MNNRIDNAKKIRLGYIVSFLLLIISLVLTNYVTGLLLTQSKRISTTDSIINSLEQTLGYTKDAETGIRGFVIMRDSQYLQPFIGSKSKIDSLHSFLEKQTTDREYQRKELDILESLLNERYHAFQSSLDTFSAYQQDISIFARKKMRTGKLAMDMVRSQVNKMQQHEKFEMDERQKELENTYRIINLINAAAIAISVMLGFFAISTFTKENRARNEADRKADDYRKRLEARVVELRSKNIELVELRSNEKFVSTGRIARTIAHEVRNPLTNINLALEQLSDEVSQLDNGEMLLNMISRNSQRIQQLVADLLNSTRFAELHFEKISINQLLDDTLMLAKDRVQLQHIGIHKEYTTDLPELNADSEKLKIAFLNIIINAVEAMEPDKGRLTIKTLQRDSYCHVVIIDNGKGMNNEVQQRLFEPYFTQKEKGSGLGLTNTQNIILNHKGVLSVESEVGKGTVFTVKIPFTT